MRKAHHTSLLDLCVHLRRPLPTPRASPTVLDLTSRGRAAPGGWGGRRRRGLPRTGCCRVRSGRDSLVQAGLRLPHRASAPV